MVGDAGDGAGDGAGPSLLASRYQSATARVARALGHACGLPGTYVGLRQAAINRGPSRSVPAAGLGGMLERHPISLTIDGHAHVEATRIPDAFDHELARRGQHWALTRMRADGHQPTGHVIYSATGTLIGVVVRCRPDWRPPGAGSATM